MTNSTTASTVKSQITDAAERERNRRVDCFPELLAALEELLAASIQDSGNPDDAADDGCVGWDGHHQPLALTFAILRKAQAAMAKAQETTI